MTHLEDPDYKSEGNLVDVLVVIITAGLFHSKPCLQEIFAAADNGIHIIPVRVEDVDVPKAALWSGVVEKYEKSHHDKNIRLLRNKARKALINVNSTPPPGSILDSDFDRIMLGVIDDIRRVILARRGRRASSTANHFKHLDLQERCPAGILVPSDAASASASMSSASSSPPVSAGAGDGDGTASSQQHSGVEMGVVPTA